MAASPASILYSSSGIPVGVSITAAFYRGTNTSGVITIPATPLTGTAMVTAIVESNDARFVATVVQRMDQVGADSDFALLRTAPSMSATVQCADIDAPVILPGDCFEVVLGKDADGSTALPYARFVVTEAGLAESQGNSRKQSISLRLDRQNSSATLVQF